MSEFPAIPDLRILESVDHAGAGAVYRAVHERLDRPVAVQLYPESTGAERVAALARLDHPNIATIHGHGVHEGAPYVVTEHVEGPSLAAMLERGPLLPDHAFVFAVELLDGLRYAHERGITHGDVRPANLFIEGEHLKISNFGLPGGDASADLHSAGVVIQQMFPSLTPRIQDVVARLLARRFATALEARDALMKSDEYWTAMVRRIVAAAVFTALLILLARLAQCPVP